MSAVRLTVEEMREREREGEKRVNRAVFSR